MVGRGDWEDMSMQGRRLRSGVGKRSGRRNGQKARGKRLAAESGRATMFFLGQYLEY